jgi:imidazoleglycerol-phosphate dehydratase
MNRVARIERATRETRITLELGLDGSGHAEIETSIGFLDHLLTALARHARIDVTLRCKGDLEVDDHHTAEDCGLVLGQAIDGALNDRRGICRFGSAYAPLDEALARAVIDFSGRPYAAIDLGLRRPSIGSLASENVSHVLASFARGARATLHVDLLKGDNDHHRAEAAFKAVALALRQAVAPSGFPDVPSTKGVIDGTETTA